MKWTDYKDERRKPCLRCGKTDRECWWCRKSWWKRGEGSKGENR